MKKITYRCTECGAEGVKLWREYMTFANHTDLYCVTCAEKSSHAHGSKCRVEMPRIGQPGVDIEKEHYYSDQIGGLVPAVPDVEGGHFWGYTSVPQDRCKWWYGLPLRKVSHSGDAK